MKTLVALALVGFFTAPAHALVKTRFQFATPPGWTNLSPGAPPSPGLEKVPPALIAQAHSGQFAFFAADLDGAADGFMENVNVIIQGGGAKITDEFLHEVGRSISEEAKKAGTDYRVLEMSLSKIGDVTVGRYVGELVLGDRTVKQVGYLLPGHDEHAIATYSTTPADVPRYAPIFDKAALATVGVEDPPLFRWEQVAATAGALVLLIGYSIVAQRRRAK
jgi:hypothetical protein